MKKQSRFIPGIYNWCDRWCDRCPKTANCRSFAREKEQKAKEPDKNWEEVLAENFAETIRLLEKVADEFGVDLTAANEEMVGMEMVDEVNELLAERHPLNELAELYWQKGKTWFDGTVPDGRYFQGESASNFAFPDSVKEDLEVIKWYLFFIPSKLNRALQEQLEGFWADYPDEERGDLGSAKIAALAIERSMGAWGKLLKHFPEDEAILDILAILERMRKGLLEAFPNYPKFVRPGFDE